MNIAVLEDERESAEAIRSALNRWKEESNEELQLTFFSSGEELLKDYVSQFDVIFLDIILPGMTGMQTAESLREKDPDVVLIFLTNMAQYAIDGYKYSAADYFVKPFSYYALKMRMDRIKGQMKVKKPAECVIRLPNGLIRMPLEKIQYIESVGHETTFHTVDGTYTTRDKSMRQLEKELYPYSFRRCNVSYLVNLKHCTAVRDYELTVGGDTLVISRAKRKDFLYEMSKYLSGDK
ncbi:MAG: response regulator transcription factor [Lachnospiraceae bacterium]|nr:response regulator transcription factor [Lachnospiraceae bacterium]